MRFDDDSVDGHDGSTPAVGVLRGVLRSRATTPASTTLRHAYATLAATLLEQGDCDRALATVDLAIAEGGPHPADADLHALRALALAAAATPDLAELIRSSVLSVTDGPAADAVIDAATRCLGPVEAAKLPTWLDQWVATIDDRADGVVRVRTLLFAAIGYALNGSGTSACRQLKRAATIDAREAHLLWNGWLVDGGRALMASTPQGDAYSASMVARAELVLGDPDEALRLANEVIRAGTAAPEYGELEAYWLRADLEDRRPADRAEDYLQVGNRLTWRGRRRDLNEAIKVYQRAIEVEPEYLDAYWGLCEARRVLASRLLARAQTRSSVEMLSQAIADWDSGRVYGPPDTAWAWLVRAETCRDMASAEPERWAEWEFETLGSAAACAMRFPDWSAGWAMLGMAYTDLCLWNGAAWAAQRCQELTGEWTSDTMFEATAVMTVLVAIDPESARTHLPALHLIGSDTGEIAELFESICDLLTGTGDLAGREPGGCDAVVDAWWQIWTLRRGLLSGALSAEAARSCLAEAEGRLGDQPVLLVERILVRMLLGDYDAAAQLWERAWSLRDEVAVDQNDLPYVDLLLHLLRSDWVRRTADPTVLTPAGALMRRAELVSLRDRARDPAAIDAAVKDLDAQLAALPSLHDVDPDRVVAELDGVVVTLTDPHRIEAVAAARAHAAGTLKRQLVDAQDLPPTLRLGLATDLVPVDAAQHWPDWSLFTETIPKARTALRDVLGVPTPGVRVVEAPELPTHGFAVQVNGATMIDGTLPDTPAPFSLAEDDDPNFWSAAAEAVERAVQAHPEALFLPSVMDDFVAEWADLDTDAERLAELVRRRPQVRIGVWQLLRDRLGDDGRLPDWHSGLRDLVASVVELTAGGDDDGID